MTTKIVLIIFRLVLIEMQNVSDKLKGKEPTRCDKICSFIASTCFGQQHAHHEEYN
jgi:hypothetical protein